MAKPSVVNIGDTDSNADWIKGLPGHKDELSIHDDLAEQYAQGGKEETETVKVEGDDEVT